MPLDGSEDERDDADEDEEEEVEVPYEYTEEETVETERMTDEVVERRLVQVKALYPYIGQGMKMDANEVRYYLKFTQFLLIVTILYNLSLIRFYVKRHKQIYNYLDMALDKYNYYYYYYYMPHHSSVVSSAYCNDQLALSIRTEGFGNYCGQKKFNQSTFLGALLLTQ